MSTSWVQPSPVGDLYIQAGEAGVSRVEFVSKSSDGFSGLGPSEVAELSDFAENQVARELSEYFNGTRQNFDVSVDLSSVRGNFHRRALEVLHSEVEFGETVTYGELAALAGCPGAARAVGTAMSLNPVAIIVGCHRVLAAGGRIGGYFGGIDAKSWLLALESSSTQHKVLTQHSVSTLA